MICQILRHKSRRGRRIRAGAIAAVAVLLTMIVCATVASGATADRAPTEYEVKAAYVFYFAKFVNWPGDAFPARNAPLIIGVYGNEDFGTLLSSVVKNKTIQERPISIRILKSPAEMRNCQIVYISAAELKRSKQMIESLRGRAYLTVTETDSGSKERGIINLFVEGDKVQFEVDIDGAERSQLQISSKLLRLARGTTPSTSRGQ